MSFLARTAAALGIAAVVASCGNPPPHFTLDSMDKPDEITRAGVYKWEYTYGKDKNCPAAGTMTIYGTALPEQRTKLWLALAEGHDPPDSGNITLVKGDIAWHADPGPGVRDPKAGTPACANSIDLTWIQTAASPT